MDRSRTYIRLCAGAQEVQAQWRPAHGDFFVGEERRIQCWVDSVHAGREVRQGFGITRKGDKLISLTPYIWLPRLDQLMELAQVPGRRFESVSQEFYTWAKTDYPIWQQAPSRVFATLEQVWLAFVMQCRQAKVWDGSSWIALT